LTVLKVSLQNSCGILIIKKILYLWIKSSVNVLWGRP
jgi:hypothetical protein